MEFPLNENNQYPLIKSCVEKMFASRTKPMSERTIEIWISEIISRNFTNDAIRSGTTEFVENEDYNLSLPIVLKLIGGNMLQRIQHNLDCPFCEGRGTVQAIAFDMKGKILDCLPYLLNCYCNKDTKNLRMNYDKKSFHKTFGNNKYFRVFKDICEQEKYLQKVYANGDMDIL